MCSPAGGGRQSFCLNAHTPLLLTALPCTKSPSENICPEQFSPRDEVSVGYFCYVCSGITGGNGSLCSHKYTMIFRWVYQTDDYSFQRTGNYQVVRILLMITCNNLLLRSLKRKKALG